LIGVLRGKKALHSFANCRNQAQHDRNPVTTKHENGVSEQELNLLQLTTAVVAQFRAGSPQIVRRDVLQPQGADVQSHQKGRESLQANGAGESVESQLSGE
jgi:hypothetical protein